MGISEGKLRTCIVGCKRGFQVGKRISHLAEFELVAVCDLDEERVREAADGLGGLGAYRDYDAMLGAEKPDVVFIATNTQPRSMLTIKAAEAGVPGIIAEKPMAMSMGEARAMVAACNEAGAKLIVTHQRRMGSDMLELRALIEEGAIGDVHLVRASCAGDLLSDGTHAMDSVRALLGDEPARWVLGQVFRRAPRADGSQSPEFEGHTGTRFGHVTETGTVSIIHFESGVRAEVLTGRAQFPGRAYQDYEIFGSGGRLWRPGDRKPALINTHGEWREIEIRPQNRREDAMAEAWKAFARYLREGGEHPLCGENALQDHELVMAVHESARRTDRIDLSLEQDAFPLQLMVDEGRL
jgi:predicted dehydrogenase